MHRCVSAQCRLMRRPTFARAIGPFWIGLSPLADRMTGCRLADTFKRASFLSIDRDSDWIVTWLCVCLSQYLQQTKLAMLWKLQRWYCSVCCWIQVRTAEFAQMTQLSWLRQLATWLSFGDEIKWREKAQPIVRLGTRFGRPWQYISDNKESNVSC